VALVLATTAVLRAWAWARQADDRGLGPGAWLEQADLLDDLTLCGYIRRYLMHLLRVDVGDDGRFRRCVLWHTLHSACVLVLQPP
jgi:hypothetical protein